MGSGGRRSIRLPEYDYTSPGAYFVTIGTKDKRSIFGSVSNETVLLNNWGRVAAESWEEIPQHFTQVELDEFIVMPNHVHGILWILPQDTEDVVGAQHAAPLQSVKRGVAPGSLGAIIRSYKSAVTRIIHLTENISEQPIWQRNYYERVLRNETELDQARHYVRFNVLNE